MPQLHLIEGGRTATPCELSITYRFDPTAPDNDPMVTVGVRDFGGRSLAWKTCVVPIELLVPCVEEIMQRAWKAYLFGVPAAVVRDVTTTVNLYRRRVLDSRRHLQ